MTGAAPTVLKSNAWLALMANNRVRLAIKRGNVMAYLADGQRAKARHVGVIPLPDVAPGSEVLQYDLVRGSSAVGCCWCCGGRVGDRLHALLVEHFEVDLSQVHWWETGTGDHVGDVGAQVRIHDVRATDAQKRIELLGRNVTRFEDTGLLAFNQESDLVFDFGGHGDGDGRLEHAIGQRLGANVQGDFDGRCFLFQEDRRGVRLFQRHVFQVDALDLEYWLQVFVRHGTLSL